MKYLLSLVALAVLSMAGCATTAYTVAQTSGGQDCRRLAQPGDTKIRIYCSQSHTAAAGTTQPLGDGSCRWFAQPTDTRIKSFCANAAQWDQFDMKAVSADVTCRWTSFRPKASPEELCLNGKQWRAFDTTPQGARAISAGSYWPQNDSLATNSPTINGGGGSSGIFPSGGAIGGTGAVCGTS